MTKKRNQTKKGYYIRKETQGEVTDVEKSVLTMANAFAAICGCIGWYPPGELCAHSAAEPDRALCSFPGLSCLVCRWSMRKGIGWSGVSVISLVINSYRSRVKQRAVRRKWHCRRSERVWPAECPSSIMTWRETIVTRPVLKFSELNYRGMLCRKRTGQCTSTSEDTLKQQMSGQTKQHNKEPRRKNFPSGSISNKQVSKLLQK